MTLKKAEPLTNYAFSQLINQFFLPRQLCDLLFWLQVYLWAIIEYITLDDSLVRRRSFDNFLHQIILILFEYKLKYFRD